MLECNYGNNDFVWFFIDFYYRFFFIIFKVFVYVGYKIIFEGNGKFLFMKFLFFFYNIYRCILVYFYFFFVKL